MQLIKVPQAVIESLTKGSEKGKASHNFIKAVFFLTLVCLAFFSFTTNVLAINKYWIGAGAGNFNNNTRWSTTSGGANDTTAPTPSDVAIFNGLGLGNCTMTLAHTVAGLTNASGYTATFNTGNFALTVNGNFQWDGGTFTAGSSTIAVSGDFDMSGIGTFNSGTSTIDMTGTGNFTGPTQYWVAGHSFNNINMAPASGVTTVPGTIIINDTLTLGTGGLAGAAAIQLTKASAVASGLLNGGAIITIGTIMYNASSGTSLIAGGDYGSAVVFLFGGGTMNFGGAITTTGLLRLRGGMTVNTQDYGITAGGLQLGQTGCDSSTFTFNLGNSTVDLGTSGVATTCDSGVRTLNLQTANITSAGNWNLYYDGTRYVNMDPGASTVTLDGSAQTVTHNSQAFYNLTLSGSGNKSFVQSGITGGTIDVNGVLTINNGATLNLLTYSPSINTAGNVTINLGGAVTKGSGTWTFDGTGSLTDSTAALQDLGSVSINNSSTRTQATAVKITTLTIAPGSTYDLAAYNFTFSSAAAVDNSGTFKLKGNETLTSVNNLDTNSGTVAYYGRNISENLTIKDFGSGTDYFNLTINDANTNKATYILGNNLKVDGAFAMQSGTFNASGYNQNFAGDFSLSLGTTYTKGGTLTFDGTTTYTDSASQNVGTVVVGSSPDSVSLASNFTADSLTINTGDTFTTNGYNVDIGTGGITINGTLNATSGAGGDSLITTEGDWTNGGTFTAGASTVTLNGTGTQDITSGGDPFNTIEITNSASDVTFLDDLTAVNFTSNTGSVAMRFNAGSTYTITNLTLNGTQGNRITLRSTSPGNRWYLNVSGTQLLSYVDVSDSNASGGDTVICTNQCIEPGGNNDNWIVQLISIPTMTEWGMIIFMVLAGLGSVYYLRKRRTNDYKA